MRPGQQCRCLAVVIARGHSTHAVRHSAGAAVIPGASGCARRARTGARHPGHTALVAAACRRPTGLASGSPPAPVQRGAPGGVGRKGHALTRAPAGAGWHGVGGRGRGKGRLNFLSSSTGASHGTGTTGTSVWPKSSPLNSNGRSVALARA